MTQALFTSMTGLNAGTQQLTVVSDNVANMNTTAYKTSRVDFQDIWYSTKTTGTSSTKNSGGTNPYQIGVGVQCAAITKDFSASSTNTTGRAEDMAITGNGNASKEQVAGMLQRLFHIPQEAMLPQLDATDGLAAAVCHFFQTNRPTVEKKYSDWKDFIAKNPDKVRK